MKQTSFTLLVISILIAAGCADRQSKEPESHEIHNAETYTYVDIDASRWAIKKVVYVPVYTSIYLSEKEHTTSLTATLSIRSTSFNDSLFISKIYYYDTDGRRIKTYINKPLLVKPMQSVQFPVRDKDVKGMGANFVIEWGALKQVAPPLIQAVMVGTQHQLGISFTTDGVEISK